MSPAGPRQEPFARVRIYLGLGRVSNLPTVWSNCLAGYLLAGGIPEAAPLLLLMAALTLFYTGGMFLNDAFDHRFDARHRPERPIPSGRISLGEAYGAGFAQLALGLALVAAAAGVAGVAESPADGLASVMAAGKWGWPLLGGVLLALSIVYYDYRHKSDPLGPLVMALCRAWVYFIAAALAGAPFAPPVLGGMAVLISYLIGLTYAAKQENLSEVGHLWPLLFLAAPFAYSLRGVLDPDWVRTSAALYAGLLGWVLYALSWLMRASGRSIPRAVIFLIAGISLLDALLMAGAGAPWPWVALAAGGFPLTLLLQRFVPGT